MFTNIHVFMNVPVPDIVDGGRFRRVGTISVWLCDVFWGKPGFGNRCSGWVTCVPDTNWQPDADRHPGPARFRTGGRIARHTTPSVRTAGA
jgi:hypothetical protein